MDLVFLTTTALPPRHFVCSALSTLNIRHTYLLQLVTCCDYGGNRYSFAWSYCLEKHLKSKLQRSSHIDCNQIRKPCSWEACTEVLNRVRVSPCNISGSTIWLSGISIRRLTQLIQSSNKENLIIQLWYLDQCVKHRMLFRLSPFCLSQRSYCMSFPPYFVGGCKCLLNQLQRPFNRTIGHHLLHMST